MILALHLSDLHVDGVDELHTAESIVDAAHATTEDAQHVLLLVTGDIAATGNNRQYERAAQTLLGLKTLLEKRYKCPTTMHVCPGNHDCDFSEDQSLRDLAVENVLRQQSVCGPSILSACMTVQQAFLKFQRTHAPAETSADDLLWHTTVTPSATVTVAVSALNTSWLSRREESYGKLYFPASYMDAMPAATIRIALMHHPVEWTLPSLRLSTRKALEKHADIVLLGHEHQAETYAKETQTGTRLCYVEGATFGPGRKVGQGFNVLRIDPVRRACSVTSLLWNGERFAPLMAQSEWQQLSLQSGAESGQAQPSEAYIAFLQSPDLPLEHRKKRVSRSDIYVTPELQTFENSGSVEGGAGRRIRSAFVIDHLFKQRYAFILGAGQSGKTGLCKELAVAAMERGAVPVYVAGSEIRKSRAAALARVFEAAYKEQYDNARTAALDAIAKERRVYLVDDAQELSLTGAERRELAAWLSGEAGACFVVGGDLSQVEELVLGAEGDTAWTQFGRYEIRPFGHELRAQVIEKWVRHGVEDQSEEELTESRIHEMTRRVDSVLAHNLMPTTPLVVLLLLQQYEAAGHLDTKGSSYGSLYEALMTRTLAGVASHAADVEMLYTTLAECAWERYQTQSSGWTGTELRERLERHCDKYALTVRSDKLLDMLVESGLIVGDDGEYRWSYRYVGYYCVARYMAEHIEEAAVAEAVTEAIATIHQEGSANIVIFLTYRTKSQALIEKIMAASDALFENVEPCNLEAHTAFLRDLNSQVPQLVLPGGRADEHRREIARARDESAIEKGERHDGEEMGDRKEDVETYGRAAMDINRGMKLMQVLGEIVRSYHGALTREKKSAMVDRCMGMGLRILNTYYGAMRADLQSVISGAADMVGKRWEVEDKRAREAVAREVVFWISEMLCFAMMRRISYAIGDAALFRVYEEVGPRYDTRAGAFVQFVLRLDHDKAFPRKMLDNLHRDVRGDVFSETLLRLVVMEHLYVFSRPREVKQRVCAMLGIGYDDSKRGPRGLPPPEPRRRK